MSDDVVQKAISANDSVQGAAIILTCPVMGSGAYQDVNPQNTKPAPINAIESKYTERF